MTKIKVKWNDLPQIERKDGKFILSDMKRVQEEKTNRLFADSNRSLSIFLRYGIPISGIIIFLLGVLIFESWLVGVIGFSIFISTLFSDIKIPAKSTSRQIPSQWKDAYWRNPRTIIVLIIGLFMGIFLLIKYVFLF